MTKIDGILKSRDITLPTKVHLVKAMVFLAVMYWCEIWTIKKAEGQRIDAFELWFWRRLLSIPWTSRRSNQSILKEISPEYSLKGLMLKLKLQYFGHLVRGNDSLEKTLMLGKIEGRRRGWQRMNWLDGITDSMDMSLGKLWSWWCTGWPDVLKSTGLQSVRRDWATELNWTDCLVEVLDIFPVTYFMVSTLSSTFYILISSVFLIVKFYNSKFEILNEDESRWQMSKRTLSHPSYKCIKYTSTNDIILIEHWLNTSRAPQTPEWTRKIPA